MSTHVPTSVIAEFNASLDAYEAQVKAQLHEMNDKTDDSDATQDAEPEPCCDGCKK